MYRELLARLVHVGGNKDPWKSFEKRSGRRECKKD
jgi:hypothetical protein